MPVRTTTFLLALALSVFEMAFPTHAQNQEAIIRLELLRGEWEENPEDLRIALLLGRTLRQAGSDDEARSVVVASLDAARERIKTEGESAEDHHLMGMAALFLKRNYTALQSFQIAISLNPEREEIHLGLVRTLLNLKRYGEAQEAIELAIALFPESESVKRLQAEVYERTDEFGKAVPILEELRALSPNDKGVFNALLNAYVKSGRADKAKPMFQQLAKEGALSEVEASIQVFRIHLTQGDLRSARVELQNAVDLDEDSPVVKGAFRDYYAAQANQAEEGENLRRAILFWERALEQVPNDWQSKYRLGLAHAALNNHEEALEHNLPLMEKTPTDPLFYANVSEALLALERFEAAGKVFQLGLTLAEDTKNEAAIERFQSIKEALLRTSHAEP